MKSISARQRFAGALAVYLVWVAGLAALAFTSSTRPTPRTISPRPMTAPAASPAPTP